MRKAPLLAALAAVLLVAAVTPAHAVPVTYSTAGVFGSSGTNILSQGGARSGSIPSPHDRRRAPGHQRDLRLVHDPRGPAEPRRHAGRHLHPDDHPDGAGARRDRGLHVHGRREHLPRQQPGLRPVQRPLDADHHRRRHSRRPTGSSKGTKRTRAGWSSSAAWARSRRSTARSASPRSPSRGRWPWPASPCRCWASATRVTVAAMPEEPSVPVRFGAGQHDPLPSRTPYSPDLPSYKSSPVARRVTFRPNPFSRANRFAFEFSPPLHLSPPHEIEKTQCEGPARPDGRRGPARGGRVFPLRGPDPAQRQQAPGAGRLRREAEERVPDGHDPGSVSALSTRGYHRPGAIRSAPGRPCHLHEQNQAALLVLEQVLGREPTVARMSADVRSTSP